MTVSARARFAALGARPTGTSVRPRALASLADFRRRVAAGARLRVEVFHGTTVAAALLGRAEPGTLADATWFRLLTEELYTGRGSLGDGVLLGLPSRRREVVLADTTLTWTSAAGGYRYTLLADSSGRA